MIGLSPSRRLEAAVRNPRFMLAVLSLTVAGGSMVSTAQAGCVLAPPTMKPSVWNSAVQPRPVLVSAVYRPGTDGKFLFVDDRPEPNIVGMWRFTMVTPGPNGSSVLVDDGYAQWHSDGTEIQNSGVHAPKTSNFCLGVWQQIGPRSYKLNHFPLAWDPTGDNPAGPIQITMTVNLEDDNHFTGSYTLKVYTWDGSELINASGAPVATVSGTISAVRVTIESVVPGSE